MTKIIQAINEPVKSFKPGSEERASLQACYDKMQSETLEIPLIIGGKEIKTGDTKTCVMPHNHQHILATYHRAGKHEAQQAIDSAMESWKSWSRTTLEKRTKIFRKAAVLLQGPWRDTINAATMLNQSKNAFQAEIDSACELIDFFNFNAQYAEEIYSNQPLISPKGIQNHLEYRPLEGFVFAITPFNFTSIAANLPSAPALMGNVALWKPASSAVLPCYYLMKMLEEAGLPGGVINFIPGSGSKIGNPILRNPNLAGVHFTGSTATFQHIWKTIGTHINQYKTYPRIVGETGGKDFCLAHESANIDELVTAMIRGAFEFQGQKCSAASRGYISQSIWSDVKKYLINDLESIKMGPPDNTENFVTAVIDEKSFDKIVNYIENAKSSSDVEIIAGGNYDKSKGYFIEPTVILAKDPNYITMREEIFGPVMTIFVFEDSKFNETLELVDNTSEYALTGAILATDRNIIQHATNRLRNSAGNFYINDKPTGAVVGKQPFGGARGSGTNDKAGSMLNLLRWVSPRLIKETFVTPTDYRYPFLKS